MNKIEKKVMKYVLLLLHPDTEIIFRNIMLIFGLKKSLKNENGKFLTTLTLFVLQQGYKITRWKFEKVI